MSNPTPPAGTEICLYEIGGIKYERTEAPDGSAWRYDAGAGWSDVRTGDLAMLEEIHHLEGVVDDSIHNHETVVHRLMERDAELTTLAARVAEMEAENTNLRAFRDGVASVNLCGGQGTPEAHREIGQFAGMLKKLNDAQQRVAAVEREREALRPLARFGLAMFVLHRAEPGDPLDGGDVQAAALDTGLLAGVHVLEPCGDRCRCREYDDFPQTCLRETPVMQAARAALAAAPDHAGDVTQMVEDDDGDTTQSDLREIVCRLWEDFEPRWTAWSQWWAINRHFWLHAYRAFGAWLPSEAARYPIRTPELFQPCPECVGTACHCQTPTPGGARDGE